MQSWCNGDNRALMNLKEARKKDKLKAFIKEHEKDPKGDKAKLDKAITSLSRTSKSTRGTSHRGSSGN